jgi:hypothetical protein
VYLIAIVYLKISADTVPIHPHNLTNYDSNNDVTTLPDVQVEPHPHGIGGHQNLAGVRRIIELRIQEQTKSPYLHTVSFTGKKAGRQQLLGKTKFFNVKFFCGR